MLQVRPKNSDDVEWLNDEDGLPYDRVVLAMDLAP
jgi:hypothetical protein